ncbi:MAG: iron-containing alcohol dehydrogenase [Deltaproteobacteria bacterium]|nr:iron-containing alcohol dehydrogenase [Deltaproteobacteria bacterium]
MKTIPIAQMSFPTRMIVGPGALKLLPAEVRSLNAKRPLIVSDRGLAAAGLVDRVRGVLAEEGIEALTFLDVSKNPKESDVLAGTAVYRENFTDLVIGLGGGAAMDVAKLVRLKCTHPLPLSAYDDTKGGSDRIHANQPPMIAIPTTAGTGSEVGRSGVVCLPPDDRKVVIFSPHMLPEVALLDAELTLDLPPRLTAATGIDAMTHALEAYVGQGAHPFADDFALAALARVGQHLERVVRDGHDLWSRHEMMIASSMGAISFQKNLGACHALAHPLSAVADLHHGLANAVMLPSVVEFNLKAARDRYAVAGVALGAAEAKTQEARAEACLDRVREILEMTGLPTRLTSEGVTPDMIDRMVPQAVEDPSAPGNPRLLTMEAARALYESSM